MSQIRVLFVDDEADLVSAVIERLELRNIYARGVTNGGDALKQIENDDFNVVILDVRMPGLGGLDVIHRIKQKHPQIAVVLISGHGSKEDVEEGLRLGAVDYLQKPVDIEYLVNLIRKAANKES